VLVGIPGAGKSTIGRLAAERAGRPFLDFDQEIERRESRTIAEIFAERGEPAFRQLERLVTEEVAELGGMILAPGGGWILDREGVDLLKGRSTLVWLKVRPETAIERLRGSSVIRPLLNRPDPVGELRRLMQQREALYAQAQHLINTEFVTLEQAVDRVVALASGKSGA
jgi:shikimate kinase